MIARAAVRTDFDLAQDNIPLPVPADRTDSIEVASVSADVTNSIQASVAKPATIERGGWEIQIAASDSDAAAQSLLAKAKADALGRYGKISPYTQRTTSRSDTLYRARFTGFDSRSAAMSACKALKSHSYACLLLPNKG
ncbi:MAG: SPOR domain-containing protein [Mesorhizobium sp.]